MTDGRIVEAHWCKAHADAYDIALRDIEAWGARENARMDREADERRRMYGG